MCRSYSRPVLRGRWWLLVAGLLGLVTPSALYAQDAFYLSKSATYATDDRVFERNDVLYMKLVVPEVNFAGLTENEFRLKPVGGLDRDTLYRGALENNFDGTYTAQIDLSEIEDIEEPVWEWNAHIEDDRGRRFEARVKVDIDPADQAVTLDVRAVVEGVADDHLVVHERPVFVDEATVIRDVTETSWDLADLAIGMLVKIRMRLEADDRLVAEEIKVLGTGRSDEVSVLGAVESLGSGGLVVQGKTFLVDTDTKLLNDDQKAIGLTDLVVGDLVSVTGFIQQNGSLLAVLVRLHENDEQGEFEWNGPIEAIRDQGLAVLGTFFLVTGATVIVNEDGEAVDFSRLYEGQFVDIRARIGSDGLPYALEVKVVKTNRGSVIIYDSIERLFEGGLVVQGRTFFINAETRIVDEAGVPFSVSGLSVEQQVRVIGRFGADGFLYAVLIGLDEDETGRFEADGAIEAITQAGVVVQGVPIAVNEASVLFDENGALLEFGALAIGQYAEVKARRTEADLLYATQIDVEGRPIEVEGPIESLGGARLEVGGFQFTIAEETRIFGFNRQHIGVDDLTRGLLVIVEGREQMDRPDPDDETTYVAEGISVLTIPEEEVTVAGTIEKLGGGAFTVRGTTFALDDDTVLEDVFGVPLSYEGLKPGLLVNVQAFVLEDGTLLAQRLRLNPHPPVRLAGRVNDVDPTRLIVSGVVSEIDAGTQLTDYAGEPIDPADLEAGQLVRALLVRRSDDALLAVEAQQIDRIEDEVTVVGIVEAFPNGNLVVLGSTFRVIDGLTVVEDTAGVPVALDALTVGSPVRVRADLLPGDELVALRIQQLQEGMDDIRVAGPIASVEDGTVKVLDNYYFAEGDTRVVDLTGTEVPFDTLAAGQTVELRAEGRSDGTIVAREVFIRDVLVASGFVTTIDDDRLTLLGTEFVLTPDAIVLDPLSRSIPASELEVGQYVEVRGILPAVGSFDADEVAEATKVKILETDPAVVATDPPQPLPDRFVLHPNFPNPFNPSTTLGFTLDRPAQVVLRIYDVLGRRIRTLEAAPLPAGTYTYPWDGRDDAGRAVASGTYLYRLEAGDRAQSRTMVLLK